TFIFLNTFLSLVLCSYMVHASLWAVCTFWMGLFATGLWIITHECDYQVFSESKLINNSVGW
ncbi:hypothetical protein EDB19DRAFT_1614931, partial [Suillus lakei]